MTTAAPVAVRPALRIDADRLWRSLADLARIGATPGGGVRRLALDALDGEARRTVVGWLQQAGCEIRIDRVGNVFARRPGTDPQAAPVACGSHVDTQPNGGRFDGALGVLAGLEAVRSLNDAGVRTRHPVEVVIWTNEEGTRFTPVMMGSGVFAGAFEADFVLEQRDRDGVRVADALAAIGFAGEHPGHALAAYLELHIEQGPVLEAEGRHIGVVEGALGQRWFDVSIDGQAAHAGPTPLAMRRDALLAAAQLVIEVRRIAVQYPDWARGTVGCLEVEPGSRNVIPGRATLTVDLRCAKDATLSAMAADLQATAARLAAEHGVAIEAREVVYFPPCEFDAALKASIRQSAEARGLSSMALVSGAGHDAVYAARVAPTAMIFVPCEGGISHNEIESITPQQATDGAQVLLDVIAARAG